MTELGTKIEETAEKLSIALFNRDDIQIPQDVVSQPLRRDFFDEKLLQEVFSSGVEFSPSKKELVLRRIFIDLINGFENNLTKICVLLDLCYYLKFSDDGDQVKTWSSLFFDLTACCILTIPFPNDLLDFYPYLVSRLSWYLEGTSQDPVSHGETNLKMGIRPPAAKLFFSVDIFLKNLDSYSKFNSLKHYELLHKIIWWVSQLIPINDHCNINRKSKIMDSYPESLWLPHLPALSSNPTLLSDWVTISEQIFLKPLDLLFLPHRDKSNIESVLHRFVDEVLVYETEFYNLIRNKNEKNIRDQAAVNGSEHFPLNFAHNMFDSKPKDSRESIPVSKVSFWRYFNSVFENSEQVVQPLPLEIDLFDLKAFQDNIEAYEYNYFRKLVLLQLYVMLFLLKEILSVDSIRQYYMKIFYQSINSKNSVSQGEYNDSKTKRHDAFISFLDKKIHRISLFYEKKDPFFCFQLVAIAKSEANTITQKISDFSNFKGVSWSSSPIKELEFSQTFKKFGWIRLGNKKLDTLWKTQSGLDLAAKFSQQTRKKPSDIYNELITGNYFSTEDMQLNEPQQYSGKSDEQTIIHQWKTLRLIRASNLFDFNKINENTGLAGFSNPNLIKEDMLKKQALLDKRVQEKSLRHRKLLEQAKSFFEKQELEKKQALEQKLNAQREAFKNAKADRESTNALSSSSKRPSEKDHTLEEESNGVKKQKMTQEEPNANKNPEITDVSDKVILRDDNNAQLEVKSENQNIKTPNTDTDAHTSITMSSSLPQKNDVSDQNEAGTKKLE